MLEVIEWVVIIGIIVTMYILLYRQERKMEELEKQLEENKNKIDKNHERLDKHKEKIGKNHERLEEHYNHFEKLWVSTPLHKEKKENSSK